MTTISLATTTTTNGKSRDDWHSVTAWGNTGVAAREIKAGDTIEVNGAIRHRMVPWSIFVGGAAASAWPRPNAVHLAVRFASRLRG